MDWFKNFSKSLLLTIGLTIFFPLLQIFVAYLGVVWSAPIPSPSPGVSFWGVPWGSVSKVVHPSSPYVVEWEYLVYDLAFWFVISFLYYSVKSRRRSQE